MKLFQRTLHIFHPDMEEIRARLSQCQTYSDTLNAPYIESIRSNLNPSSSPLSLFRQLKQQLRKDVTVKFYSLDRKDYISICSDFFSYEGAFDMSKFFFEDLDAFVMAVSCIDGQCFVSFIRGKTQIGSVSFDLEHMAVNDIVTCIGTYVDPILKQHEIDKSSFNKVFENLKSVQTLSEKQALQLLKENGQIDKFIL